MSSPGDVTLASYEVGAERYRAAGPSISPVVQTFLDELVELMERGTVLEVGAGPGVNAEYLESQGIAVERSDGAPAFVEMMRADGHTARVLDIRSGELGGPYDAILAVAVFVHLARDEFEAFLVKAREAVPRGLLAFTLKRGDGARWSTAKLGLPRHFTFWQESDLRPVLARTGWAPHSIAHIETTREPWLNVIAQPVKV